ncbi:hypothetical protein [Natrinema marinum]|nr:hypothetical protein [Natrinema marinum]
MSPLFISGGVGLWELLVLVLLLTVTYVVPILILLALYRALRGPKRSERG